MLKQSTGLYYKTDRNKWQDTTRDGYEQLESDGLNYVK